MEPITTSGVSGVQNFRSEAFTVIDAHREFYLLKIYERKSTGGE